MGVDMPHGQTNELMRPEYKHEMNAQNDGDKRGGVLIELDAPPTELQGPFHARHELDGS